MKPEDDHTQEVGNEALKIQISESEFVTYVARNGMWAVPSLFSVFRANLELLFL